jgi:hypothetical protein
MEITAGTYDAKVVDYGVIETKAGKPGVTVKFEFTDQDGTTQRLSWWGYFASEKNSQITCDTLALLGWSTNDPSDLAQGAGSGVLDEKREVSIVVAPETWEGVTRMKVKYINALGGNMERMEKFAAKKLFSGMNLAGLAADARKKYGAVSRGAQNTPPKADLDEELPF